MNNFVRMFTRGYAKIPYIRPVNSQGLAVGYVHRYGRKGPIANHRKLKN